MTGYTFSQLFDFTRTTAGTFVGSNGLIQNTPASVNLLTFTQEFDNAAWAKVGTVPVVTANATVAPDGTTTADQIFFPAAGSGNRIQQVIATTAIGTVSIWLRGAIGGEQIQIWNGWSALNVTVTLTTSWQRFVFTESALNSSSGLYLYAVTGTPTIFAWGAQLELGSTATAYTRNNGGVFPARFEYDPVTLAPRGILIEEQRTNSLTYSNTFSNAVWVKDNLTVAQNVTSPEGPNTGWTATNDATNAQHRIYFDFLSSFTGTRSIYVKAGTANFVGLSNNGSDGAVFDLLTGLKVADYGSAVGGIQNAGNGWYRINILPSAMNRYLMLFIGETAGQAIPGTSYVGTGKTILLWGAQLEAGTFVTSYIPTVASQVTRSADICSITAPMFAPWYTQSDGTFVVEFDRSNLSSHVINANDGTANNRTLLYTNSLTLFSVTGGTNDVSTAIGFANAGVVNKASYAYQVNNFAGSVNGGAVSTDTSGLVPVVNRLAIGMSDSLTTQICGHIRRVTYYPFRASNNQLQALTT
jgi:hypothetical protein